MLQAVIGIGSNSTRLLVGEVSQGRIVRSRRMREGTRLFAGLQDGALSQESMLRTADAVARFAKEALALGVAQEDIHIIATSAARDADNAGDFSALIKTVAGSAPQILSGDEEARLSFLASAGNGYCGMIDIGGGSTEIATGGSGRPLRTSSIQLGAVRLFSEVPILLGEGIGRAFDLALSRVEAGKPDTMDANPPSAWYIVGGTATCLASVDMRLPAFDAEAVQGHALTCAAVENWARRLAKMSQEERAQLPGMLPTRVDIIAHGAIILWTAMQALKIERILVSNRTNLDGYLLELNREQGDSVQKVKDYYDASVEKEWERLMRSWFEFEINKRYIDRYVKPGQRVLDVGGGPGRYALHLAQRGAVVTLADLSEGNVAYARAQAQALGLPVEAICCDAREIEANVQGQFDAILLMGPLYHLLEEADRVRTVQSCLRLLKPGGVLFVAFISIVAGMIYAAREVPESILWEGEEMFYRRILDEQDFAGPGFTEAFMIYPSHIDPFMSRFGMERLHLVGSESISAPFHQQLMRAEPEVRDVWLQMALALCERETFYHFSEHFLYIGRKKEEGS